MLYCRTYTNGKRALSSVAVSIDRRIMRFFPQLVWNSNWENNIALSARISTSFSNEQFYCNVYGKNTIFFCLALLLPTKRTVYFNAYIVFIKNLPGSNCNHYDLISGLIIVRCTELYVLIELTSYVKYIQIILFIPGCTSYREWWVQNTIIS